LHIIIFQERIFDRFCLGAKERGLAADSSGKYEIQHKNIASPSQKLGTARAMSQNSLLLLLLHVQATYLFISDLKARGFLWNILVMYFLGLKSL